LNIFVLDKNITLCAQYHNDKHCVKMLLEYVQMLSMTCRLNNIDAGYAIIKQHINHPCSVWTRKSKANWLWLFRLTAALHKEYQFRYQRATNHKSFDMLLTLPVPNLPEIGLTKFALAMPKECVVSANGRTMTVASYRNYYITNKQHLATWKNRPTPNWFLPDS
jgi:hypothetical protein